MWSRVAMVMALAGAAIALPISASVEANIASARFMRVYGTAPPPYGFVQFCQSYADECRRDDQPSKRLKATSEQLAELDRVNRRVNADVAPATDLEIFGVREHWTFPGARGDCEDYAILKRHILMERGWPASSLLLTVVYDEIGEGHAVLTVRTAQGDFILDNKVNDLRAWNETPYTYLMRQSYLNPQVWMALDPKMSRSLERLTSVSTNH